jgi:hypothetical protein
MVASIGHNSNRRRRGASSVEYILVLALVVIPLALMANTVIVFPWSELNPQAAQINDGSSNHRPTIINAYFKRMSSVIVLPVG